MIDKKFANKHNIHFQINNFVSDDVHLQNVH